MADLKENLARLDDAVPAFPGQVAAVARSAEALEQTASALVAQFEQKQAEAHRLAEQVKQALGDLTAEGTDQEAAVRGAADEADHAIEAALSAVHAERDQLLAAVEDAGGAFGGLQEHLAAAEVRVRAAEGDAQQALASLETGLAQAETELSTGATDVITAIESAGDALDVGQGAVAGALRALEQHMTDLLEEARARVRETINAMHEADGGAENGVSEAMGHLLERKDGLFTDLAGRVHDELRAVLDAALQRVVEALGRLSQTVQVTTDAIQSDREGLHDQFGQLRERIPPLLGAVESVRQAANQLGVEF